MRNNPLVFTDPTGRVTAAQCGAISNPSQSQFCWNQRYYEARGSFWDGHDWKLDPSRDPVIDDAGVADEVLAEAGIGLQSEAGLSWMEDYRMTAGSGVAKFGQKLSGGLGRLKALLGGGATMHLVTNSPQVCGFGQRACAPAPWLDFTSSNPGSNVYLPVGYFSSPYVHMDIVHELAHIIDWHGSIEVQGRAQIMSWAWNSHAPITNYAMTSEMPQWDKFAEAVTVAVFGLAYEKWAGPFDPISGWQAQSVRMLELLNGWR